MSADVSNPEIPNAALFVCRGSGVSSFEDLSHSLEAPGDFHNVRQSPI